MNFKDKVLFLGDSITRHYFPYAKDYMCKYAVEAIIPEKWVSCQWKQIRTINYSLRERRKYKGRKINADTVHFNFGLHSVKLPNKGHDQNVQKVDEKEFIKYEYELQEQITTLNEIGIKNIIFTNTTPSPKNHKARNNEDIIKLNEIAYKITKNYQIPYNDIYSFVKNQENYKLLYTRPLAENNCHFDEKGRRILGEQVAEFVLNNM